MNIPKEAQAILRRMRRRGYGRHNLVSEPDGGKLWYAVEVGGWFEVSGKNYRDWKRLQSGSTTILKCCRDIEKQWKAEK